MSAMKDREITQKNVSAKFQSNSLVADSHWWGIASDGRRIGPSSKTTHPIQHPVVAHEAATVDHPRSRDRNIRQVLAPDQTVMEISVTAVLIRGPFPGLGQVVD